MFRLLSIVLVLASLATAVPMNGEYNVNRRFEGVHESQPPFLWSQPSNSDPWHPVHSSVLAQAQDGHDWLSGPHPWPVANLLNIPRRPLDATDHEILASLSADLAQHIHGPRQQSTPSSSPPRTTDKSDEEHLVSVSSPAQVVDKGKGTKEATSSSLASEERRRSRIFAARRTYNWPEPRLFANLDTHPAIKGVFGSITPLHQPQTEQLIIEHFFGGHLHWASHDHLPDNLTPKDLHRRSPYAMPSRIVPLVGARGASGEPVLIFMTEHNVPIRKGGMLKGTLLDGKPYYAFWGVPNEIMKGGSLPLAFYGAGWVERGDEAKVDRWLGSSLEELKRAARGRAR